MRVAATSLKIANVVKDRPKFAGYAFELGLSLLVLTKYRYQRNINEILARAALT